MFYFQEFYGDISYISVKRRVFISKYYYMLFPVHKDGLCIDYLLLYNQSSIA